MYLAEIDQQDILEPAAPIRAAIDEGGLEELADSIRELGLLQPILVQQQGKKYEVIAGHRRLLATRKIGLPKVHCMVADDESNDLLLAGRVHENIVRRDISPVEEAVFYAELMEKYRDVDRVCAVTHRSRAVVESRLLLLTGDPDVLRSLNAGEISLAVASELNMEKDTRKRKWFLESAVNNGSTMRQVNAWRRSYFDMDLDGVNLNTVPEVAPDSQTAKMPGQACYLCGDTKDQARMRWVTIHDSCMDVAKRLGWTIQAEVEDAG